MRRRIIGDGLATLGPLTGEAHGEVIGLLQRLINATDPRELRALGERLKPHAHELAGDLLQIAKRSSPRNAGDPVPIPPNSLGEAILILLALARPQRGRPPKKETQEAWRLLTEGKSKRGVARAMSRESVPFENIRRRLRPKKPKPKR